MIHAIIKLFFSILFIINFSLGWLLIGVGVSPFNWRFELAGVLFIMFALEVIPFIEKLWMKWIK